ncbi:MAG TPA: type II toxin-antitoxin system RelE/ParE family toxin [Candidatus Hydrogenedentes bacterium]|nr:type II toxin-antitoxin system RelE/ParE family toxin [Candidatus Hydrogenedentota bacterium]
MDAPVRWSPEAREDLRDIAAYIARDSATYARAVVTEILNAAEMTGQFPQIGRIVPETNNPCIRERFVYSYGVICQLNDDHSILIIAIIHGKRLLKNVNDRFA